MTIRRRCSAAAAGLAVLVSALALPGVAAAHSVLVSTDPARDSTVDTPPARVSGTFNEPLQPLFPAMTLVGPDGATDRWDSGDASVSGAVLSVAMKPGAPAGKYTVTYRVTSEDGHPVGGTWSFTVAHAGAPGSGAAPTTAAAPPAADTDEGAPIWPFGVAAVIAVGFALFWSSRRGPH